MKEKITVETKIQAPLKTIWELWSTAEHIEKWNNASPDWHTPSAINNFKPAGKFIFRMEARDGSAGFDLSGTYTIVEPYQKIEYKLDDGRMVRVDFIEEEDGVALVETFDAEQVNSLEMQKSGWQAILNTFKAYVLAYNGRTGSFKRFLHKTFF